MFCEQLFKLNLIIITAKQINSELQDSEFLIYSEL